MKNTKLLNFKKLGRLRNNWHYTYKLNNGIIISIIEILNVRVDIFLISIVICLIF